MKFRKPEIHGKLAHGLGVISLGFFGGTMVGILVELDRWSIEKTALLGLIGIILLIGTWAEDRRFNKRNLINHDQEKRMTTIVYGDED